MASFEWPVRVYYEDTDAAGVVYYANYLKYMERARSEWLRKLGFEQDVLIQTDGIVFAVRSITVDYLKPARFNDALVVYSGLSEIGKVRLTFDQEVCRPAGDQTEVLARGVVEVVSIHAETLRPRPIPKKLREAIDRDR